MVYSRDREIAEPLFERFEQETGIEVRARWGNPIELAEQIVEGGADSPADASIGRSVTPSGLSAVGVAATLSEERLDRVPEAYRTPDGTWSAVSGRAHVVFYNTDQLGEDDLPTSIDGYVDPLEWPHRLGTLTPDPCSRVSQRWARSRVGRRPERG